MTPRDRLYRRVVIVFWAVMGLGLFMALYASGIVTYLIWGALWTHWAQ